MANYYRLIQLQALGYFLIFSAFNAVQNLAGSIPGPPGLASAYFFTLYFVFVLGCIPAPYTVSYLGPKRSMVLGGIMYLGMCASYLLPPMCTNFNATETCISATSLWIIHLFFGALCGLGAAVIWTGQGVYLSRVALLAAENQPTDNKTGTSELIGTLNKRYNGVFFSFLQLSGATGNLAAFVLTTFVPGINNALHWLFIGLTLMCAAGVLVLALCLPQLTRNTNTAGEEDRGSEEKEEAKEGWEGEGKGKGEGEGKGKRKGKGKGKNNTTGMCNNVSDSNESNESNVSNESNTPNDQLPKGDLLGTLRLCVFDIRMRCLVPIIFYNGASLGFLWSMFNKLGWNASAGFSFVALGSAYWFFINTVFSPLLSSLSEKKSYITSMLIGTGVQGLMYVLLIMNTIEPLQCNTSGCSTNTSGPCWLPNNNEESMFPMKCANQPPSTGTSSGNASNCVQCFPYNAEQQCSTGLTQCAWLGYPKGDALAPHANTMILLFTCSTLFAIGDAVWETQLPSVLQTIFKDDSSKVTQSISNLKMFQSIGVTLLFAFSYISDDIQLISMVLLIALGWGTLCMYYVHARVVNLDTGLSRSSGAGSARRAISEEEDALLDDRR
jgi:hypothetical protein